MSIGVDVVVVDSLNNSLDEFIHFFESQVIVFLSEVIRWYWSVYIIVDNRWNELNC